MEIYKIVFTGGPCAGKTKLIEKIKKYFENSTYEVIIVPETATILLENGLNSKVLGNVFNFQNIIFKMQHFNETLFAESLKGQKNKKIIMLYDRGILDNKAYCNNSKDFDFIIDSSNGSEINFLDNYNLVFNLITTADCSPEKYTFSTNMQRTESIELAKIIDKKISNAWTGHRNIKIINSNISIEEAFEIIIKEIGMLLNKHQEKEIQTIPLDNKLEDFKNYNDENSRLIKIQEIILNMPINNINFILFKRTYKNKVSYIAKIFNEENNIQTTYFDEKISYNTYLELIEKYKIKDIIFYNQLNFIENRQEYKIKFFDNYTLLELEENKLNNKINYPECIKKLENDRSLLKRKKYDNIS